MMVRRHDHGQRQSGRPGGTPHRHEHGHDPAAGVHGQIALLQRTAGNAAVEHLLAQRMHDRRLSQEDDSDDEFFDAIEQQDAEAPAQEPPAREQPAQETGGGIDLAAPLAPLAAVRQLLAQAGLDEATARRLTGEIVEIVAAGGGVQEVAIRLSREGSVTTEGEGSVTTEGEGSVTTEREGSVTAGEEPEAPAAEAAVAEQQKGFWDGDLYKGVGNLGAGVGMLLQIVGIATGNRTLSMTGAGLTGLSSAGDLGSELNRLWEKKNINWGKAGGGALGVLGGALNIKGISMLAAGTSATLATNPVRNAGLSIILVGQVVKAIGEGKKWEEWGIFDKSRKRREPTTALEMQAR
ncbi:hypothetical protein [Actinoplanes sp. NPDC051851]|uniref:hypothetical protein n=1 Tax=Actinoplanes sp. NPDC051851 TaxID=3154753 RepID=UPI00342B5238